MTARLVGVVSAIFRYPVKSMAGESLDAADVSWNGIDGDRRWAFVREGTERSGFPWLTLRQAPQLWQYVPRLVDTAAPETSVTMVRTPSGDELDVIDPALASELGHGARVIRQKRGIFDAFPLSLITEQTVAGIASLADAELDVRRFRPNILVDATDGRSFSEDEWVGRVLRVGEVSMRIDKRDKRCITVNVDPVTSDRDPSILRAIADNRESQLGVYASTVSLGRIAVGDSITIEA
jgi:uncharacterized protein YcbX